MPNDPRVILAQEPMGRLQVVAVTLCILLLAVDGFDVLSISFAAPGIAAEWGIDRAALGETRIARGCKLDNLVQVGHSVTVGEDTVLAGQVGIAGSSRVGKRVTLAGQVGVAGHLTIGDGAIATAKTGIPSSVKEGTVVSHMGPRARRAADDMDAFCMELFGNMIAERSEKGVENG